MKRLIGVVVLATSAHAAACVPVGYSPRALPGPYGRIRPYPSLYGASPAPVGRWDNVMLLPDAAPVLVLMMDGRKASGEFVSANAEMLTVLTRSGQVELVAADVMRVDRVPGSTARE